MRVYVCVYMCVSECVLVYVRNHTMCMKMPLMREALAAAPLLSGFLSLRALRPIGHAHVCVLVCVRVRNASKSYPRQTKPAMLACTCE